jgi:hypothetical protein
MVARYWKAAGSGSSRAPSMTQVSSQRVAMAAAATGAKTSHRTGSEAPTK